MKKNKLYINSFNSFIKENFNNEYYDKILDLHNKIGIDKLQPDELNYLKSGGKSKLPERFTDEINQQKYDDFISIKKDEKLETKDWNNIFSLQKIIDRSKSKVYYIFNYNDAGYYLDLLCSLIFEKEEEILSELKELDDITSFDNINFDKKNRILYTIPKVYLSHLTNVIESKTN